MLYLCALFMDKRITYLDVARGLAILLVIFYHVPLYIPICHPDAGDLLLSHIHAGTYILPFFMPVFFVISGYFTKTSMDYWQFLWGDVKHLLLVGLLLTFINVLIQSIGLWNSGAVGWFLHSLLSIHFLDIIFSNWFVAAIFFARQIYYGIDRLSQYLSRERNGLYWCVELIMLTFIAIAGILIEPHAPHNSQWFYCQGFVFALFIAFGKLLRSYPVSKWWMLGGGGIYILLMMVAHMLGWSTLEYGMINTSFTVAHWPFYMLLALSGSVLLIGIAQLINHLAPLEFVGRHSLIFYIPQGGILYVTGTLLGKLFLPDSSIHVWLYILIMWGVTLLGLSAISWIQEGWQYAYSNFWSHK
jgi:fucose 4-O-acetylase-like acetyltransferase